MLKLLVKIYIKIASILFYWLLVAINKTLRVTIIGSENYYKLEKEGKKIVFVFWHQASFVPIYTYRNRKACILTIGHLKGEILARAAEYLGYQAIRLKKESDRQGTLEFFKKVQTGFDCNIAVDGPEGPIFKMKPGAVYIAAKLGNPILPIAIAARPKITLFWRWDKYFIPLPFAKVVFMIGSPIDASEEKLEIVLSKCETALINLNREANLLIS